MNDVSKYKAAVGKRNVGSDPSAAQMQRTRNTAIGRNRSSSVTNNSSANISARAANAPHRGSMEGLKSAPSTLIQPNGSGYLRTSAQKARNTPIQSKNLTGGKGATRILSRSNPPNVHDMRGPASRGGIMNSASILSRRTQLNNVF